MIKNTISSVSYEVLINGAPYSRIVPERGFRQGDPLSPYLFILVHEALTRIVNFSVNNHGITDIKVRKKGPAITHVLYADDLIIFCRVNIVEAKNLNTIMDTYCLPSGQKVNYNKSFVYYSSNVEMKHRKMINSILKVKPLEKGEKYLDCPMLLF